MKGLIVIGYPGIGKTSCANPDNKCIDLESSIYGFSSDLSSNGTISAKVGIYCQQAIDIARQGYTVFTSSHKDVRNQFSLLEMPKNVVGPVIFCPTFSMADDWIERLWRRYEEGGKTEKDLRAYERAKNYFKVDIFELIYSGMPVVHPTSVNYDLMGYVREVRDMMCKED